LERKKREKNIVICQNMFIFVEYLRWSGSENFTQGVFFAPTNMIKPTIINHIYKLNRKTIRKKPKEKNVRENTLKVLPLRREELIG